MPLLDFQKYFSNKISSYQAVNHGGNNLLFRVKTDGGDYLIKKYADPFLQFDGYNRGNNEFSSISKLRKAGLANIPNPISYFPSDHVAVYSFIDGDTLNSSKVTKTNILDLATFLTHMHNLPTGTVSTFQKIRTPGTSLSMLLERVEARYLNLVSFFDGSNEAKDFIYGDVKRSLEILKKDLLQEQNINKELSLFKQAILHGDFGVHNMILRKDDSFFVDFEYCGRDDPVNEVLGFLHHDRSRGISTYLFDLFLDEYRNKIDFNSDFDNRLRRSDPIIGMEWVLIYLNPFNSKQLKHMNFSREIIEDIEVLRKERLGKARAKLGRLRVIEN